MSAPRCPTLGGRPAGHTREYDRVPAPQGGFVIRASSMHRGHPVDGRAHHARLERNALILVVRGSFVSCLYSEDSIATSAILPSALL